MFGSFSRIAPVASSNRLLVAASVSSVAAAGCVYFFGGNGSILSSPLMTSSEAAATPGIALSKSEFTSLKVSSNVSVGLNVRKITLDFPNATDVLGMKTAGMLMVKGDKRDGSGQIARPYTPVSRNDTVGKLELVVKDYPGVGNVSTYLCAVPVGTEVDVKGCYTKIAVEPNKWKKIGLIAGGSGLTPCLQVAEELLDHPDDRTEITLIFCNRNPASIFLSDHIDALVARSKGRFKVHYCVDEVPAFSSMWDGLTGYVTADMVQKYLPAPDGSSNIIMVCGPPPMYKALCGPKEFPEGKPPLQGEVGGVLKDLGYTKDAVFKF